MLPFCEPGDSYSVLWIQNGLSRCFSDIFGSLSAGGVLFVIGLSVFTLSGKPKTKAPLSWRPLSQSKPFIVEFAASCVYVVTFLVDIILKGCLVGEKISSQMMQLPIILFFLYISDLERRFVQKSET